MNHHDDPSLVCVARTDEEIIAIQRLRYEVYIAEQGKRYPNADHSSRLLSDRWDADSTHFQLKQSNTLIAAVRYTPASVGRQELLDEFHLPSRLLADIPTERFSVTSRLVSIIDSRRVMRALRDLLVAIYLHGVNADELATFIHCRTELVSFFQRLGFRIAGEPFQDGITQLIQVPMVIVLDDIQHFEANSSPFATEARKYFLQGQRTESLALLAQLKCGLGAKVDRGYT